MFIYFTIYFDLNKIRQITEKYHWKRVVFFLSDAEWRQNNDVKVEVTFYNLPNVFLMKEL